MFYNYILLTKKEKIKTMENFFKVKEHGSTVKTEVLAGITSFMAMAYILTVNANMFSSLGVVSYNAIYIATAISAVVGTLLIGLLANLPLALASGMGLNAFFVYTVCFTFGLSYANALVLVLFDGVLFIILTITGVRAKLFNAIPMCVRIAITAGIGLFIAFYKLFVNLFKNFFGTFDDIFHKKLDLKNITPQRNFMYMTVLSFMFFIIYAIPAGKYGNFYMVFHRTSFNKTILGEGICMALLGVLLIVTNTLINSSRNKLPDWANAIILGMIAFLALPTGGCSFMGAIFAFGILLGMSQKYAIRYAVTMSVPTLIVMGIVELCVAVTKINIFSALIGIIVSAAISFFAVKLFIFIVNKKALNYIAYYDISIGVISAIIGAFQLVIK